jgi:hypothetical protein
MVVAEGKGFYLGLDLGQSNDYSAIVILERVWEKGARELRHVIRDAYRYPLKTQYPDVVTDVMLMYLGNPQLFYEGYFEGFGQLRAAPKLIINNTGVGQAVADDFNKRGVRDTTLKRVTITGGLDERFEKGSYHVPKSRLFERLQVDAHAGQLKIAGGMELLETLKRELPNNRPKTRAETAYLSYEEIREGVHDDLVLAAALSHWGAHRFNFHPT